MKIVLLIQKGIRLLYRQSRAAFILFLLVQVTVSTGFIFFFTTTYTTGKNYLKQYDSMRTIRADLQPSTSVSNAETLPDKLMNNSVLKPTNIVFTFILPSEKNSASPRTFTAYQNPTEFQGRIQGQKITEKQIQEKASVLVSGNFGDPTVSGNRYQTGTTVKLDGTDFKVIGTDPLCNNTCGEIPYTVGLHSFSLLNVSVMVPADAVDDQKEQLGQYLHNLLPEASMKIPVSLTQKTFSNLMFPFIAGLLVGVSALINLLFIFKYMLESSRKSYFVFQACGCNKGRLVQIIFGELLELFTGCFVVGAGVFAALRSAYSTNNIFKGSELLVSHVFAVYLLLAFILMLIILPYLRHYGKQIINSGGEL